MSESRYVHRGLRDDGAATTRAVSVPERYEDEIHEGAVLKVVATKQRRDKTRTGATEVAHFLEVTLVFECDDKGEDESRWRNRLVAGIPVTLPRLPP